MEDHGLDDILGGGRGEDPFRKIEEALWSEVPFFIPTGCTVLDYAIGGYRPGQRGGIPHGKVTEIWGPESCGKSALLASIVKNALNMNFAVFLADDEMSHERERLLQIGVNPTNLRFIERPEKLDGNGNPVIQQRFCLEEYYTHSQSSIQRVHQNLPEVPILLGWDSLASMDTKRVQDADYEKVTQKDKLDKSDIMGSRISKFASFLRQNNGCWVIVDQLRESVMDGGFGKKFDTAGGIKKKFVYSIRIRMHQGAKILPKDDPFVDYITDDPVGLAIKFNINKNKIAPPFRTGHIVLYFDERGICDISSFVKFLIEEKMHDKPNAFEKAGAWYSWKGDRIGQGQVNLCRTLKDKPELMEEMVEGIFGEMEEEDEE